MVFINSVLGMTADLLKVRKLAITMKVRNGVIQNCLQETGNIFQTASKHIDYAL